MRALLLSQDEPDESTLAIRPEREDGLSLADATTQWLHFATGDSESLGEKLKQLVIFISERGFTPPAVGKSRGQAAIHYEKHVTRNAEWPPETSLDDYVAAAQDAVLSADKIFTHRFRGVWQVGFWREVEGERPILVQYRLELGRWTTVFRPAVSLEVLLAGPEFEEIRWIRK